ncbi:MAG: MarR family transcriptional regulator [Selenomonadaceae bacterium]|nr:MarR family transcriptional regulator [Selenomonadaceae bacterium]
MDGTENLTETFLDAHHLMYEYQMAWYRRNFGGIDPRHGQGRILTAVSQKDYVTQKELGVILNMRPQALGELVQKLEANGYISRRKSLRDKRSLVVELTEKGEEFIRNRPYYEALFSDMSDRERENLRHLLQKIGVKLEELIIAFENEDDENEVEEDDEEENEVETEVKNNID